MACVYRLPAAACEHLAQLPVVVDVVPPQVEVCPDLDARGREGLDACKRLLEAARPICTGAARVVACGQAVERRHGAFHAKAGEAPRRILVHKRGVRRDAGAVGHPVFRAPAEHPFGQLPDALQLEQRLAAVPQHLQLGEAVRVVAAADEALDGVACRIVHANGLVVFVTVGAAQVAGHGGRDAQREKSGLVHVVHETPREPGFLVCPANGHEAALAQLGLARALAHERQRAVCRVEGDAHAVAAVGKDGEGRQLHLAGLLAAWLHPCGADPEVILFHAAHGLPLLDAPAFAVDDAGASRRAQAGAPGYAPGCTRGPRASICSPRRRARGDACRLRPGRPWRWRNRRS